MNARTRDRAASYIIETMAVMCLIFAIAAAYMATIEYHKDANECTCTPMGYFCPEHMER